MRAFVITIVCLHVFGVLSTIIVGKGDRSDLLGVFLNTCVIAWGCYLLLP